ncbi:MAG: hypothetical protein AAF740_04845, partial [Bacteroidota bacterium]
NGIVGNRAESVRILGEDSILVLITAEIDRQTQNDPLLIEQFLEIETAETFQEVPIHAWGRNAILLRDRVIRQDEIWTNEQPYILLNTLIIDSLQTLTIQEGVEIYSYPNAFVVVAGRLNIEGSFENPVLLTGVRQEEIYRDAAGQWGGIVTAVGSQPSHIRNARIRNALWGVRAGTPDNDTIADVRIEHTVIENMADAGILAFGSDIEMKNSLINNCLNQTFAGLAGGTYKLDHVTLANFSFDFIRQDPSILFTDLFETGGVRFEEDLFVEVRNSILWGALEEEIFISDEGVGTTTLSIANSILRTEQIETFDLNDNLLNVDPKFEAAFLYNYSLDTLSPAQDQGLQLNFPLDLLGNPRDEFPDIGAYEFQD